jgi:hypothetical protein
MKKRTNKFVLQVKTMAKMMHEKRKVEGKESSIARCHEEIARKAGYRSYNHLLSENK